MRRRRSKCSAKTFSAKYALTDQGVRNTRKGAFWTVIVNLVVMGGMSILYLLMADFMGTLTDGAAAAQRSPFDRDWWLRLSSCPL